MGSEMCIRDRRVDFMADKKEPPGILIGYFDKEELAPTGRPLPSHVER